MTTTTTTTTKDFSTLILDYELIEEEMLIRVVHFDASQRSVEAIRSLPRVYDIQLGRANGERHAILTTDEGEDLFVSKGDYVIEAVDDSISVETDQEFTDKEYQTLMFRKRWTQENLHEWDMDDTSSEDDWDEIAKWVEAYITRTATPETIQDMLDSPDSYASMATQDMGWYDTPQTGGITVNIWKDD